MMLKVEFETKPEAEGHCSGESLKPRRLASSTHPEYFFAIRPSAPQATIIRIEPSTSPAIEDAFSSACSFSLFILTIIGIVTPYTATMATITELVTSVRLQLN
jgi:hypothetical protein